MHYSPSLPRPLEPIQSGDSYTVSIPKSYIPGDTTGYVLHVSLANAAGYKDFEAAEGEEAWTVSLSAADTAGVTPGAYNVTLFLKSTTDRRKISETVVEVLPDYLAREARSAEEERLDLISTEINRRIKGGDASYSAAQVSITKIDFKALCDERDKLIEVVRSQKAQRNLRRGIRPAKIVFQN